MKVMQSRSHYFCFSLLFNCFCLHGNFMPVTSELMNKKRKIKERKMIIVMHLIAITTRNNSNNDNLIKMHCVCVCVFVLLLHKQTHKNAPNHYNLINFSVLDNQKIVHYNYVRKIRSWSGWLAIYGFSEA